MVGEGRQRRRCDLGDADHVEAAKTITIITDGNFRLIERLMTQIVRVMTINNLDHWKDKRALPKTNVATGSKIRRPDYPYPSPS